MHRAFGIIFPSIERVYDWGAGRVGHFQGPCPPGGCPFIRMSYSQATDAELEKGIATLARVLRTKSDQANGYH